MATNRHLDVRTEGRESVINRADDDLKNLSLTIIAARGNRFVFLPEQQFYTNRVNTFYKYVLHLRVCVLVRLDVHLFQIQANRLIHNFWLINLALGSRDSIVNKIYNPKQRTYFCRS
jgi:hypothetical protein